MGKIPALFVAVLVLFGCLENEYITELKNRDIQYNPENFIQNVASGNTEIVSLFLKAGMGANLSDSTGRMALWEAKKIDNPELVALLINGGASYKSILPLLIKELDNPDESVRHLALQLLKRLGPDASKADSALIETISASKNISEISLIILVLKSIGTEKAVQAAKKHEEKLGQQKKELEIELINISKIILQYEKNAREWGGSIDRDRLALSRFSRPHDKRVAISMYKQSKRKIREYRQKFRIKAVEYERIFGREELLAFTQKNSLETFLSQ